MQSRRRRSLHRRPRVAWRGRDVFHFDGAGKIVGKLTYVDYDRPQLRSDL